MSPRRTPKKKPPPLDFVGAISRGNLTEMREILEAKKPLRENPRANHQRSRSALEYAVSSGFFSMVELLLRETGWSEEELCHALGRAVRDERVDLVNLLLDHDAAPTAVRFMTIIELMDIPLIDRYLEHGADFAEGNAFFHAINSKRARPLLRIYRTYRDRFPVLDDQIARALVAALREKLLRWSILLIWAGADPTHSVPHNFEEEEGGPEEDNQTTGLDEALQHGDLKFVEQLNLKLPEDYRTRVLANMAILPDPAAIREVLTVIAAEEINSPKTHSCAALESMVSSWSWEIGADGEHRKSDEERRRLEAIELLLDAGARWNPPRDDFSYARRALASHDGQYVVQVIRLLLYTPGAAPFEKIWEICRTGRVREKINLADHHLWDELKTLHRLSKTNRVTSATIRRIEKSRS